MSRKINFLDSFQRFGSNTSGSTQLIFSLSIIPMLLMGGAAMDLSRAVRERTELYAATDSAILAAARVMKSASSATLTSIATAHLTASHNSPNYSIDSGPTVNADKTEVCMTSITNMPTTIMKIAQINYVTLKAQSCAKVGGTTYEVALALDNTGSMGSSKMASMKIAAKNLIDQLLPASQSTHYAQVSLIPFNYAVKAFDPDAIAEPGNSNEQTRFANVNWLDHNGGSSIHWENFPQVTGGSFAPASRFELHKNIGTKWAGCLEARPGAYALADQPASAANPDSLYVPQFAPDEGDNASNRINSYLSDFGNSVCEPGDVYKVRDDASPYFGDGQSKLCKYKAGIQVTIVPGACTTQRVCDQTNLDLPGGLLQRSIHSARAWSANTSKQLSLLPKISEGKSLILKTDRDDDDDDDRRGDGRGGGGSPWDGVPGLNTNCNANPAAPQCVSFCQFQPNAPWCSQGPSCRNVETCEPSTTVTTPLTISADESGGKGPNQFCTIRPVTQLSQDAPALKAEIEAMSSGGNTNLISGIAWAWKTISPNSPYAQYKTIKPYNAPSHEKVIVFMTDGDNTWGTTGNANGSYYSPFGYFWNKRLGKADAPGKSCHNQDVSSSNRTCYMDAMTLKACNAAKAAGIKIYTIGFSTAGQAISSAGQALLEACASTSSNYYLATNANQLNAAFAAIGDSLQGLRISR